MIDAPEIVETVARDTAAIHLIIPKSEIRSVMGPAIAEVLAAVAAAGLTPAGPLFSHHHRIRPEGWDFEVGVPVEGVFTASGRVRPGRLRAATVARTIYRGPYEGLGEGWGALMKWIEQSGHEPAEDLWEVYAAGPESSPDPAEWRTELNRPLVR